jgi:transposase
MKRDGRTLAHQTSEEFRRLAVRRVVEDAERPSAVMDSLGLCRTTIYRWLRSFQEGGWEALASSIAAGPAPKLTPAQCQRVKRWIVGRDPRQYGFEFGLWTRQIVAALIDKKFKVSLGLTAVGKLLARLEITPQKPLRRAYERNPAAVTQWVEQDYPQLRQRAKRVGAKIFFLDEAGFQSDPVLGRSYGLKGQPPVLRTSGQRQQINALSAVNAAGAFWCATYPGKFDAQMFILFLRNFLKGRHGKVFLVVDGHPAHRAKRVAAYIQSLKGRLELHFLPPYAPDLNPDEFVWSYMKGNGVSKRPLRKNESLRRRVEADFRAIQRNVPLIRSFFQAKSVAYAKD